MFRFLAGNIYLTGEDKRKSIETLVDILDFNKDGFISQSELEKIMIATRGFREGDNYGGVDENKFEQNGREDAANILKKCDSSEEGKVSTEKFISTLLEDPDFEEFRKRFNLDQYTKLGPHYSRPGKKPLSLGDLLKD